MSPILENKDIDTHICNIASGDRESLHYIYANLKHPIYLFSKGILKKHEAAEDITQQTFIEVMECAINYRPKSNGKAWIYTITRNLCMDYFKKTSKEMPESELIENHSGNHNLEEQTLVDEALALLNDIERQIITLYMFEGFRQTEIAEILDIPYIKIRSIYGYIIRKLKAFYED